MMSSDIDAATREAANALETRLLDVMGGESWSHIEPGQILDAENLLDLYGEDVRARAFVFDGPDGDLCLRPDLTLSICRYHLTQRHSEREARYVATGPVFRRPLSDDARAGQFSQISCEWFGGDNPTQIDADIFARTQNALLETDCAIKVKTGDLGIIFSLIDAAPIPDRWRARLKRHVWRPRRFHSLLHELSEGSTNEAGRVAFLKALGGLAPDQARSAVAHMLDLSGTEHVGLRTHEEISQRFLEQAEDAQAHPLPREIVTAIEATASLKATCADALNRLHTLAQEKALGIAPVLAKFEARLTALERLGIDAASLPFDGDFGRNLEYYDGFVFEITAPDRAPVTDRAIQLAGGGRYDSMLPAAARAFGVAPPVATGAIGAALRPETILAVSG